VKSIHRWGGYFQATFKALVAAAMAGTIEQNASLVKVFDTSMYIFLFLVVAMRKLPVPPVPFGHEYGAF
jgi:hypothetical protein